MPDFNCYRGPGMCVDIAFLINSLSSLSTPHFLNKVATRHLLLNVPNAVIWEGEGEVSVPMPE